MITETTPYHVKDARTHDAPWEHWSQPTVAISLLKYGTQERLFTQS